MKSSRKLEMKAVQAAGNVLLRVIYTFRTLPITAVMFPSPDILNNYEHGKFVLANLAAKRAKQLREGAMPLVSIESNHPLTIALAEIAAGKIKATLPTEEEMKAAEQAEITMHEEVLPAEFGMLLPGLDESDVAVIELIEDESEIAIDDDGEITLSDLVEDEHEEEAPVVESEDDTLSLSDIAEQETALDEDESTDV